MGVTNKFRPTIFSPQYRQMRGMPVNTVSTAISCSCSPNDTQFNSNAGRYIYYLISAALFVKFDTWTQTAVELTPPPIAPLTFTDMEFMDNKGFEGRVLAATSTTFTIPTHTSGSGLLGYEVEIVSGTGAGQKRFITSVAEPIVTASGVATAVNNAQGSISITDTTQAFAINSLVGMHCRIAFGAGVSQIRRVMYNSATVITMGDSTKSADDYHCNPAIFSPAISATAGSQSVYSVESSVITINAAWGTTPDTTSRFRILSGGILLSSSAAATPFYTMQYYDILADTWYIRSANQLMVNVIAADNSIDHSPEVQSVWQHNLANGTQTTTTLQDLAFTYGSPPDVITGTFLAPFVTAWTVNQWVGYHVYIVSGTGAGQMRLITGNTSNTLTVATWGTTPDSTSEYMILGYTAGISSGSNSATTINDTTQAWGVNSFSQYGVKILFGTGAGQYRPIASNTATALTVLIPWTTTPDSTSVFVVHADHDKCFTHMSNNTCIPIYNIDDDMLTLGRLQDSGTAGIMACYLSSQAEAPRWRGSFKPQAIATITFVTTTGTVTTVNPHNFQAGQSITIVGATGADAAKYNVTANIIAVTSATVFTYTLGSTPAGNAVGSTAQSTTTLTDATKAWTSNQFAGMLCTFNTSAVTAATGSLTMATALISSNTATTLTLIATTAPVSGQARYVIHPEKIVGSIYQGAATGGAAATITDTGQAWVVNILAGRRIKITGGTGQGQEATILSNTATVITVSVAWGVAPAANSTYAVLQQGVRGVGAELIWADNGINQQTPNARYMYIARGGAVIGFDRFDVTTDICTLLTTSPSATTLTTGSMYAYDGANRMYFTKIDAAQERLYYLDLTTYQIHGGSVVPFAPPIAVASNRMEVFRTKDGVPYLWVQPAGNYTSYLVLLFW
jgi:hypothetical protein